MKWNICVIAHSLFKFKNKDDSFKSYPRSSDRIWLHPRQYQYDCPLIYCTIRSLIPQALLIVNVRSNSISFTDAE